MLEGEIPVVPVKTASDIPKDKILACVQALKNVKVTAPVEIGEVIVHDIWTLRPALDDRRLKVSEEET